MTINEYYKNLKTESPKLAFQNKALKVLGCTRNTFYWKLRYNKFSIAEIEALERIANTKLEFAGINADATNKN